MNKMLLGLAILLTTAGAQIAVAAEDNQVATNQAMETEEFGAMTPAGDFSWLDQEGVARVQSGQHSELQAQDINFRVIRRCRFTPHGRRCIVTHGWR